MADDNQQQASQQTGAGSSGTGQAGAGGNGANQPAGQQPAGQQQAGAGGSGTGQAGDGKQPVSEFESFLSTLAAEQRALLESHERGLKTALDSEREARKELERQIKQLSKTADESHKAELKQLQEQLDATNRRSRFAEEAHLAGVNNITLAYLAAQEFKLFDANGQVNLEGLREKAPQLFVQRKAPPGNGGEGSGGTGQKTASMNDIIRSARGITLKGG